MRKSYIALSLILSQALCADTDLIADFGNNTTNLNVTKPTTSQTQKDFAQQALEQKATYGVDWNGGIGYLNLRSNNLTFTFNDASNKAQNLILSDGFTIRNNIISSDGSKTHAKITIAKNGSSLKTLLIGQNPTSNNKVTIGSDINLVIESFSNIKVISNLYLGANSTFDVSNTDALSNDGGIVLEGKDSTLKVKDTLINNGVIMMREGSKIDSISNLSIVSNPQGQKNGSILIQGKAEINSGANAFIITNQDITLQNLVSKQDGKITTTPSILALKTTGNGTLTLGDSTKGVNITGEIGNRDPSNISNTQIPQGSEIGKLVIEGFSTIDLKDANFKNIALESASVSSLDFKAGKLGLENTSIQLATTSMLKNSDTSNPSTITLKNHNSVSVGDEGTLSITGNHSFEGEGTLDFVGKVINLGDSLSLSATGIQGLVKIGVSAKENVNINNFTLTDLTLQVIESQLTNTSITLSNATLQGIDHNAELSELNIIKNGSNGSIKILNGKTATFEGSKIILSEQDMSLENSGSGQTALILKAGSEGITFNGGESGSKIEGKSSDMTKNLLFLQSPFLITQGKVTLENIVVMSNRDVSIVGTEAKGANGDKGLFITKGSNSNASTLFIGNKTNEGARFYTLTLTSQDLKENQQAYVKIDAGSANPSAVDFRASSFIFQNQEIDLATSASGTKLRLFAYGDGLIDSKFLEMKNGSPTAQLSSSGVFNFSNTTFSDGSSSKVELYAGNGGVTLLPNNLTLKNVSLDAKIIDDNGGNSLNTLDLSSGSINILGTSIIGTSKFIYGDEQGIGVDLFIGNESTKGNLTLKANSGSEENFTIGGEIALDLRGNGGASSVEIEITNGSSKKLSDNTLGLAFKGGGGLSIIGSSNNSSHTFKAKTFKFEELKESDDTLIASPFLKVQNTQLTLNGASSMNEIDIVGTTYLLGDSAGSSETKLLATNNGNTTGNQVTLKLHDIEATGKASIADNKLSFENSNIKVSNSDSSQGLLLKDNTTPSNGNAISGNINSITLESGKLQIQQDSNHAVITLKAGALLTSSGTSSLSIKTIKVAESGLYSLKVNDGIFTLTEESAENSLGAITLGSEQTPSNSAGGIFEYKKNGSYNSLTFKDNLTSYGNSSIVAQSFTLQAKDQDQGNYALSSTGGILTFKTQESTNPLEITTDLTLKNGGFKYVDKDGQNAELRFGSKSSITSSGESVIEAKNLDMNGVNITSTQGTLSLKGINSNTKVGKVSVGNAGVLRAQGGNFKLATLRVNDSIALSAAVPYITPSEPLGKGVFGQVVAESILFESQDTSPLITLSLTQASQTSIMSDSLFALREGGIMLIDTNSGIKKKISSAEYGNITLEDVKSDLGSFSSISLTPYLKYGTDTQGRQIVEDLMLNLKVTQKDVTQLVESIKDPNKKAQMQSLLSSANNTLIIQSIMNSKDNPLKAGMALYISNGDVGVVANTLEYVTGAFIGLNDSLYASHKIAQGLKMIKAINVENRMVRGKNPYLAKLEVARLLKRAVGVAYASNDDEILLEDEESGVKEGELWVSFDGAMGFSKTLGNASVYGFSGGYDTLLGEQKNYLLGFYFGYGYGSYSANFATNNSHNVSLGFYSRMSFENNEVDLIASQSIGLNTAFIDYGATNSYVAQMLKQSINYNFYTTDIEARYGYVFSVGEKESPYYFRPFGGINFAMVINSEGKGDGEAPIGMNSLTTYQLGVNMGVEMRKYFGENYIFLLPMLEKGLLNDGSGTKIGFVGSQSIGYNLPYTVDTAMSVYLGGQGNVGENIAISGGAGVKVGLQSKEVLTNWNVGIRYKF